MRFPVLPLRDVAATATFCFCTLQSSSTLPKFLPNGWAKNILSDVENLTEEKIDDILNQFLKDFKEGSIETKGWPAIMSAYNISKAALHGYSRILAKTYSSFYINVVCPGYVKTDMTQNCGLQTPDEGAESVVRLALLPNGSPSGLFFLRSEVGSF
ncbi:(+)-neomenthol dehydrogenase [Senna tora]|uniref:(+)-neomenthol dehydrogenase n=1 Tax=Senna tora TaxID=362788 RepID=A0A834W0X9_9FABA|nr:(+)-neomenthol dehydrogenase [Senna tora]